MEVELGYISGVFGVRGEVRLYLYNPASYLLGSTHSVVLKGPSGDRRQVTVRARPGAGKRILGRITGVDDRDAAAALQGWKLLVARDALPALEVGEYYYWQAEGADVLVDGERIGRVRKVHSNGPVELFEIDLGGGDPLFVPSLGEFVRQFDPDQRTLHLHAFAMEE